MLSDEIQDVLLPKAVDVPPVTVVPARALQSVPQPLFRVRDYTVFDGMMQDGRWFLTHQVGIVLADRGLEPYEEPSMRVLSATLCPFAVPAPANGLQCPRMPAPSAR
jgi:hypothetical protein